MNAIESVAHVDSATMRAGLLMDTVQAQQKLAAVCLKQLKVSTQDLNSVVREEVRGTLVQELEALSTDTRRAAEALAELTRTASRSVALWTLALSCGCTLVGLGIAWWVLPSREELSVLRARRAELATAVSALERQGGRIDLRRCGADQRWCVRVDRDAPVYGTAGDYRVVLGY